MSDFDEPTKDPANYKLWIFYYNPKDSRFIVPKRIKWMGWTLNYAKPGAYLFLILVFLIVLIFKWYLLRS